jgi:hypothetical protein
VYGWPPHLRRRAPLPSRPPRAKFSASFDDCHP